MSGNEIGPDGQRVVEGIRALDRLHAEARISREIRDRVASEAGRTRENALDLLVDFGMMPEAELLRFLATMYQTQFVSTEKLAKAGVERAILESVPARVAEKLACFPILFDARTGTLSVVAADLEQHDVAKNLALVSQARQVKVYVARPRAVKAAIRRGYYGDGRAFQSLLAISQPQPEKWAGTYDVGYGADAGFGDAVGIDLPRSSAPARSIDLDPIEEEDLAIAQTARVVAVAPAPAPKAVAVDLGFTLDSLGGGKLPSIDVEPTARSGVSVDTFRETVGVLVTLLDQGRDELRGHSAEVARVARAVASRLGLDEETIHDVTIAGYLHDLGKSGAYHLTALNVAHHEGHRAQAQKLHAAPAELLAGAKLPVRTLEALTSLYERFDGQGLPRGLAGESIPIGARILAVAETFVDVTSHAKNPYRRRLAPDEACEAMSRLRGTVFDSAIVDALRACTSEASTEVHARVLVVDPDRDQVAALEVRLVEQGFRVQIVRDAEAALAAARDSDAVVSEVDLGATDGFALLERLRRAGRDIPFVFLARRADRATVVRAIDAGASDYLVKPALPDVVAAKLKKALSDELRVGATARRFAGSLSEMGLPDVVQVLSNGHKTGRLVIRTSSRSGDVTFRDGLIFEARFGELEGARAFYEMLLATEGEFVLDSTYVPERNLVQQSTEGLLLEGMRLLDERRR